MDTVLHTEEIWVKKGKGKGRKIQFIKYILFVKNNLITKYSVIK